VSFGIRGINPKAVGWAAVLGLLQRCHETTAVSEGKESTPSRQLLAHCPYFGICPSLKQS